MTTLPTPSHTTPTSPPIFLADFPTLFLPTDFSPYLYISLPLYLSSSPYLSPSLSYTPSTRCCSARAPAPVGATAGACRYRRGSGRPASLLAAAITTVISTTIIISITAITITIIFINHHHRQQTKP
ncbi:transcription factor MYB16 isoform X2 [Iris pallida]|uniref:Transcription factor MYB16 isoform X2 n=1 Tax=Iris pallida TaxID=29817 RepID=A0AAX6GQG4_IRIPA|nr:transcription factor MYB16 isoform X2 [Iris pallida]